MTHMPTPFSAKRRNPYIKSKNRVVISYLCGMAETLGFGGGDEVRTLSSSKYVVGTVPTVLYIPEYVSAAEEEQLLKNIYQAPLSKWKSLKNRRLQNWGGVVHEKGLLAQDLPSWLKKFTNRICEESGLFPSAINHVLINEYLPGQGIMPHQDGPAYMPVVAILSLGSPVVMDFVPHANLKSTVETSGDDGEDIISGPSHIEMSSGENFSKDHLPFSVVLMPRSLLIFKDMAYSDYLHGIKDSKDHLYDEAVNVINGLSHDDETLAGLKIDGGDRVIHRTSTRVSLTCRLVTKVRKNLIKI